MKKFFSVNQFYYTSCFAYIIERDTSTLSRQEFEGKKYNVVKYNPHILLSGVYVVSRKTLKECRQYLKDLFSNKGELNL